MILFRLFRRWLIARAIRRIIVAYRVGRAEGRQGGGAVLGDAYDWTEVSTTLWTDSTSLRDLIRSQNLLAGDAARSTPQPAEKEPGRQRIPIPGDSVFSIFGGGPSWVGPIPKDARTAAWEDLHTFPAQKPTRDMFGLHGDPPLSFVCPACELEQPPMSHGKRTCGYCGLRILSHGLRLFWWREEPPVEEWKP